MGDIIRAIRRGFAGLVRFSGRDARGQFWPYAICIFLLASLASYAAMIPELMRTMENAVRLIGEQANASGPPLSPEQMDAMVLGLMPNFEDALLVTRIVDAVAVALLAAAVTRRLHDRDRAGYWGLLPLPGFATGAALGFALTPTMVQSLVYAPPPTPDLAVLLMLINIASWALLIVLVVQLAREGSPGPNRFGPEPADAPAPG